MNTNPAHTSCEASSIWNEAGYLSLVKDICNLGVFKEPARHNMPRTKSLFGNMLKFDLTYKFPLFTTKKMFTKGMIAELLWFLKGDTNIKWLDMMGVKNFWHQDAYRFYVKKHEAALKQEPNLGKTLTFEEWCDKLSKQDEVTYDNCMDPDLLGECGDIYGYQWRQFDNTVDQIAKVIQQIKTQPFGRYKVVTAWNPSDMPNQALPACHMLFQFNCRPMSIEDKMTYLYNESYDAYEQAKNLTQEQFDRYCKHKMVPELWLDCSLTQRSADMMLGVPINVASYALLTYLIAWMTNCNPGVFTWFGNDCHVYEHHIESALMQCDRLPNEAPTLKMHTENWYLPKFKDDMSINDYTVLLDKVLDSIIIEDFEFIDYKPQPAIKYELCTGLFEVKQVKFDTKSNTQKA